MFADPVADLPGQIQALAVALEDIDNAEALLVVLETARHEGGHDALAMVPERGVAQVVAEGDGLGQVFVERERLGDGPRDLRHLEGVRQAGPVVVAGGREEHLRLVLEASEGLRMQDAITVALERRPDIVLGLRPQPAARVGGMRGLGRQRLAFAPLQVLANRAHAPPPDWTPPAVNAPRKLRPQPNGPTPNSSASVCPRSAKVARVPRSTAGRTPAP